MQLILREQATPSLVLLRRLAHHQNSATLKCTLNDPSRREARVLMLRSDTFEKLNHACSLNVPIEPMP